MNTQNTPLSAYLSYINIKLFFVRRIKKIKHIVIDKLVFDVIQKSWKKIYYKHQEDKYY